VTGRAAAAALLSVLVAAGCATPPADNFAPPLSGRLSLQVAAVDGQPARGVNASFDLRGNAEAGELRLSSLLGPQIAAARWSPGSAVLVSGDGETRFPDLSALAQEALGEDLPLQALPDWLQGRPWPGAAAVVGGTSFEQLGWLLDLARQGEGFITAIRARAPTVTLRVRLENR
jgi:outer membrane lipoprotein LolB